MSDETHGTLGILVGLDRHLQDQFSSKNMARPTEQNSASNASTLENSDEYVCQRA